MSHLIRFEQPKMRLVINRDGSYDFDTIHRIIGKDGEIKVITGTEYLKLWTKRKLKQLAVWSRTMQFPHVRRSLKKKRKK